MTYQYDLFLSFANEDRETVAQLEQELTALGLKVWCSITKLREEGKNPTIDGEIAMALPNCRYFVAFMSENYVGKYERLELNAFTHHRLTEEQQIEGSLMEEPISFENSIIPVVYGVGYEFVSNEYFLLSNILYIAYSKPAFTAKQIASRINPDRYGLLPSNPSEIQTRKDTFFMVLLCMIVLFVGSVFVVSMDINQTIIEYFFGKKTLQLEYKIISYAFLMYSTAWAFGLVLDSKDIGGAIKYISKDRVSPTIHNPIMYIHTSMFFVMTFCNLLGQFYYTMLWCTLFWVVNIVQWYLLKAGLQPDIMRTKLSYQAKKDTRMKEKMQRIDYFLFGRWQLKRFKNGFYYLISLICFHFFADIILKLPHHLLFGIKMFLPLFVLIFEIWFWKERIKREVG
jgi:hypothetical protein